eukprot:2184513-Pyramimonas_sp.AAC.1
MSANPQSEKRRCSYSHRDATAAWHKRTGPEKHDPVAAVTRAFIIQRARVYIAIRAAIINNGTAVSGIASHTTPRHKTPTLP